MKQTCVLDANSILTGVSLELGGTKLVEWLSRIFDIYTPCFVVKKELPRASKDYELEITEIHHILQKNRIRIIADECFVSCVKVTEKWLNKSNLRIDEGELYCLALCLYLSKKFKNFVFLISDDFKARNEALDKFVNDQKIGFALSSPDIVLYAFSRNQNVTSDQTLLAVQDFFATMKVKKVLDKKEYYSLSYEQMCRKVGFIYGLCQQECYGKNQVNWTFLY